MFEQNTFKSGLKKIVSLKRFQTYEIHPLLSANLQPALPPLAGQSSRVISAFNYSPLSAPRPRPHRPRLSPPPPSPPRVLASCVFAGPDDQRRIRD